MGIMGKTDLVRSSWESIENNRTNSLKNLGQIRNKISELKNKVLRREMTYREYEWELAVKHGDRSLGEWHDFYSDYLGKLERIEEKNKARERRKKIFSVMMILLLGGAIIWASFAVGPKIVGFVALDDGEEGFIDEVNFSFTQDGTVRWIPKNNGRLSGIALYGNYKGQTHFKIFLEDKIIIDSKKLSITSKNERGSPITGFAVGIDNPNSGEESSANPNNEDLVSLPQADSPSLGIPEENQEAENSSHSNGSGSLNPIPNEDNNSLPQESPAFEINLAESCTDNCENLELDKESYNIRVEYENTGQEKKLEITEIFYTLKEKQEVNDGPKPISIPEGEEVQNGSNQEENDTVATESNRGRSIFAGGIILTTIHPNGTNQEVHSGAIAENTYTFTTNATIGADCLANISAQDGAYCKEDEGSTAFDAYFLWNVTLPATSSSINWLHLSSNMSKSTTLGSDTLMIAAYNWTSGIWANLSVINPGSLLNLTLTHNFTSGIIDFINASAGFGNQLLFMARTNGTANINTDLQIEHMFVQIEYNDSEPTVTITSPTNTTYNTESVIFRVTNNEVATCQYTLDGGINNVTMQRIGLANNHTNSSIADGNYNVRFYCNDTANQMNSSAANNITFHKDTVLPVLNIVSPLNQSYTPSTVHFNISANEEVLACELYLDSEIGDGTTSHIGFTTNLQLLYHFRNETGENAFKDWSDNSNNLTTNYAPNISSSPAGKISGGLKFPGHSPPGAGPYANTTSIVNITNDSSDGFTISMWVRMASSSAPPQQGIIVSEGWNGLGVNEGIKILAVGGASTYNLQYQTGIGGGSENYNGNIPVNAWKHLVIKYNRTAVGESWVYLDGLNVYNGTTTNPNLTLNTRLIIGNSENLDGTFNGSMDEIAIWNTSLTDSEVLQIYNGQKGIAMQMYNTTYANYTNSTMSTKSHWAWMTCNDTSNNYNYTLTPVRFSVATVNAPKVYLNIPPADGQGYNKTFSINVTTDIESTVQYSLDGGITNITMQRNGQTDFNHANSSIADGIYTIRVYANSTTNNANLTVSRTITADSIQPTINFTNPTPRNNTYNTSGDLQINITSNDTNNHTIVLDFGGKLYAWLSFDNATDTSDKAGNSPGITITDNSTTQSHWRIRGGARQFTNSSIKISNIPSDLGNSAGQTNEMLKGLTVAFWIKASNQTLNTTIIEKFDDSNLVIGQATKYPFAIKTRAGQNWINFSTGGTGALSNKSILADNVLDDRWHYVAAVVTREGGQTMELYVDGVLVNSSSPIDPDMSNNDPVFIGSNAGRNESLNGSLDEVMIFARSLTAQEINASYNAALYKYYRIVNSLSEGTFYYKAYSQDIAGNIQQTETRQITIDTTAPTILVNAPQNATYTGSNITFNFTTNEDTLSCLWSLDAGRNNVSTQANGLLDFSGRSNDGRISEITKQISWVNTTDLLLVYHFNNDSALGENNTRIYDDSLNQRNGTAINQASPNSTGKIRGAYQFDGSADRISLTTLSLATNLSASFWVKWFDSPDDVLIGRNGDYIAYLDSSTIYFASNQGFVSVAHGGITSNTWYHFAVTRDANTGQVTFYKNGTSLGTANRNGTVTVSSIGAYETGDFSLNGLMDEVAIWNRTLTSSEISGIYANQSTTYELGNGQYTTYAYCTDIVGLIGTNDSILFGINNNFAPIVTINKPQNRTYNQSSIQFNVTTDNTATCQYTLNGGVTNVTMQRNGNTDFNHTNSSIAEGYYNARFYCNSTANEMNSSSLNTVAFTIDAISPLITFASPTPNNGTYLRQNTFIINVTSNNTPADHETFVDINRDLRLWLRFNNETNENTTHVRDWSTWSNNATRMNGVAENITGKYREGVTFDGANDYITVPYNESFDPGYHYDNYTFSFWMNTHEAVASDYVFAYGSGLNIISQGNKIVLTGGSNELFLPLSTNAWTHVAGVKSTGLITLYVNGASNTTTNYNNHTSPRNITLGGIPASTFYNGSFDELLIFKRALNETEIGALYNASTTPYRLNLTNLAEGNYTFRAHSQGLGGHVNSTDYRTVIVDFTAPTINVNMPANTTYATSSISFNFTTNEDATCLVSLNGGINNQSMQKNGQTDFNYTNSSIGEGGYQVSAYCNDTAGNLATNNSIHFSVSNGAPQVNIIRPQNTTYNTTAIQFNVSTNEAARCNFTLTGGIVNYSMTNSTNASYFNYTNSSIADGNYNARFFCWDMINNLNSSENVTFGVDKIRPGVTINSPTNQTYSTSSIIFNVTLSENGDTCYYTIDFGVNNVTMQANGLRDFTDQQNNLANGAYTGRFYCNDSVGNFNNTENVTFSLISSSPLISYVSPTPSDQFIVNTSNFTINLSTSDSTSHSTFVNFNNTLGVWYKFNNNLGENATTVRDWAGIYKENATAYNGARFDTSGILGGGWKFDGKDDYLNASRQLLNTTDSNFTISFWIKENALVAKEGVIFSEGSNYGGNNQPAVNPPQIRVWVNGSSGSRTLQFAMRGDDIEAPFDWDFTLGAPIRSGVWEHVVITSSKNLSFDISGVFNYSIYVNNEVKASKLKSVGSSSVSSIYGAQIGGEIFINYSVLGLPQSVIINNSFNGTIDDFQIHTRTLLGLEVGALYNTSINSYTINFSDLKEGRYPFVAYSQDLDGNVNVTNNRTVMVDAYRPSINFTNNTPANNSFQSSNYFTINLSSSDKPISREHMVLLDYNRTLLGWYRFNNEAGENSTTVKDWSSYSNALKIIKNSSSVLATFNFTGKYGSALSFSNPGSIAFINKSIIPNGAVDNLTISFWYLLNQNTTLKTLVDQSEPGTEEFRITANSTLINISGFGSSSLMLTNITVREKWNHLVLTKGILSGNTDVRLYFNGVLINSTNVVGLQSSSSDADETHLGARIRTFNSETDYITADELNGSLDDLQIYSRALNVSEIRSLYNSSQYPYSHNFTNVDRGQYTFVAYVQDLEGNVNQTETRIVDVNTTKTPIVSSVSPIASQSITEGGIVNVLFNATINDGNGHGDISTIRANFTNGSIVRTNNSCIASGIINSTARYYNCTVGLWYFDAAGQWNVTVYAEDSQGLTGQNTTTNFSLGSTVAFTIHPTAFSFSSINPGDTNKTPSNNPLVLNNTGNAPRTSGEIKINATHLVGETNSTYALYAGNFTVGINTGGSPLAECGGTGSTRMSHGALTAITGATLAIGNLSINDGTAQEQLYICLNKAGNEITQQAYSTSGPNSLGSWTISIAVALLTIARRKKLKGDKRIRALSLIYEELKEEYDDETANLAETLNAQIRARTRLNKQQVYELANPREKIKVPVEIFTGELGGLEGIVKYLKENMSMTYSEIGQILKRDERTIWNSYKKASEKNQNPIKLEKVRIRIPLETFASEKLTILESLISYLKKEGFNYAEIGRIIGRDQRNIRTIHVNAEKKEG
jgi:hypothetical protein